MRWFFGLGTPAIPLKRERLGWSLDGEHWDVAPRRYAEPTLFSENALAGIELDAEGLGAVQAFLNADEISEPLARQILLEAAALQSDNPRAAVVLAVAAAEIGVKVFAASSSTSASEAWLLQELQSPPLGKLIRAYVPRFTNERTIERQKDNGKQAVPAALRRTLDDAVEVRNKLVHRGEPPPAEEVVAEILAAVNDLLYLLDWFQGHAWAFGRLSDQTQAVYAAPDEEPQG